MSSRPERRDRYRVIADGTILDQPVAVVGIDGSPTSWDAFWWACGEAQRSGRQLVTVYVSHATEAGMAAAVPFAGAVFDYRAVEQTTVEIAERLRAEIAEHARDRGVQAAFVHARGDPAQELVRVANSCHADLLVVGRSTSMLHHLAGSLGRRLLGKDDAPIVVVVP